MPSPNPELSRKATKLYTDGQFVRAEKLFAQMRDDEPDNYQLYVMIGLCRRGRGDFAGAMSNLRKAVEYGDSSPEAHYYLGRVLMETGQAEAARESLAQALALNPNHVRARTMMGMISLLRGDPKRAVDELQTVLRANERHVPALAALARAYLELDETDKAHEYAGRAIQLDPADAGAQAAMGRVYLAQGHLDFAEQCLRNALDKHPDNPEVHAILAQALQQGGRDGAAVTYFNQALAKGYGGAELVMDMAVSLSRTRRFDDARRLLEQARERWPEDADLTMNLAEHRLLAGDALAARDLAEETDGSAPKVRLLKARIAHDLCDAEQVGELLDGLKRESEPEIRRQAHLLEGRLATADEDLDAGRRALEPLMQATPPDRAAVMQWVELCRTVGEDRLGADALGDLIERGDLDGGRLARVHDLRARLLDGIGEYDLAAVDLEQAGWRPAPVPRRVMGQRESGQFEAWRNWTGSLAEIRAPDDGRPPLLIVLGWPGSGRDLIAGALTALEGVQTLDSAGLARRRESLYMPMGPGNIEGLDEVGVRGSRKRFLRGLDRDRAAHLVLDPAWWEVTALPPLARFFPGVKVIVPHAAEQDLELHWRLSAYTGIEAMRETFRDEKRVFEVLRDKLPMEIVPVRRGHLLDNPETVLTGLCETLGLEYNPALTPQVEAFKDSAGYRPDGHWRHYKSVIAG